MAVKQTAARKELGEFAPKFAELNDDVLFGEVWSREDKLSLRDRSLVTVTSLMSQGLIDSAFRYHLESAKKNGITKEEITEILTHNAFYAGWPKAWAAFRMAKEVWNDKNEETEDNTIEKHASSMIFPIGEPKCRNNWHIHHSENGGGQILICVAGRGYYQEWGKKAIEMLPGDVVNIPANVKHWHGASADSYFSHLAIEVPGENTSNEWLEAVSDNDYFEAINSMFA